MKNILGIAAALGAAIPVLAGPYDQPYALVESGDRSDVRKELPVQISSIDGKGTMRRLRSIPLAPGRHEIDVWLTARTGPTYKHHRLIAVDAAACTRYRIVAHYTNLTHLAWEPVVRSEPIGECQRKFRTSG